METYSVATSGVDIDRVLAALPAYEVGEELGRGTWGVVLAGRHRQLGRPVAIKELPRALGADPLVRARFIAEGRLLATLDHPHVVPVFDFVEQDGLCLLVMDLLTGGTVGDRFRAQQATPQESCAMILAVCAALQHAHARGVLHRDIKPDNLLFSQAGVLKVADFGIAKVIGGSATVATTAGEVLGTPAYIAPEQATGAELGPATDIYATATILYELLSGRLPFPGDSSPATALYRHVHEHPQALRQVAPSVSLQLAEVIDRALASSPVERYQSAEEFGVAVSESAAEAWGPDWLAMSGIPVSVSGPMMAAALKQRPVARGPATIAVPAVPSNGGPADTPPPDLVPVQAMLPRDGATATGSALATGPTTAVPAVPDRPNGAPESPPPASTGTSRPFLPNRARYSPQHLRVKPPPKSRRGRRGLVLIGVVAVVAAAVGGGVALSRHPHHRQPPLVVTQPAAAPAPVTGWHTVRPALTARQQVASTAAFGKLWVFGGLTTDVTATATVEAYDPATDQWATGPSLPRPVDHPVAVTYRGVPVVIGGFDRNGQTPTPVSDRVYQYVNGVWQPLPSLNHARAAAAAAVVGDKIVLVGGQANEKLVSATEVFDGTRWRDVTPIPTARDHLAAVADGHYVYAVGGRVLNASKNLASFERYDPVADHWDELAPLPTARGGLGAAIVGNRLVTLGGEDVARALSNVEAFDLTTNNWATLAAVPTARHGMAVFAVGNALYAIDGGAAAGHLNSTPVNETITLSPIPASRWAAVQAAPTSRQQVASTVALGKLWVFGGLTTDVTSTATVENYDPAINQWAAGPSLPRPVDHAAAVTYRDNPVVLGGFDRNGVTPTPVSDRVFQLVNGVWQPLPSLIHARAAAAAAVVGGKIVVMGGQANERLVTTTEVFDGTRWHEAAPMHTARDHLAAVTDGHYVYAVGGWILNANNNLATVERYDPVADRWDQMPDLPTPRGGLSAAIVGDQLIALGGEGVARALGTVEAFDLTTRTWATLASMPTPRHGMAVQAISHTLYAIDGGGAAGHSNSTSTSEVLAFS